MGDNSDDIVIASVTFPNPEGTLCDFSAKRGCRNVVPDGQKKTVIDRKSGTNYRVCIDCYTYQTNKASSVVASSRAGGQSTNRAVGGQSQVVVQGLSARGRQMDTLSFRQNVLSAQRPDYGRPIPKVIALATPPPAAELGMGPTVMTPAFSAPVMHAPSGYTSSHQYLNEDVKRWASGNSGKSASGPAPTGFLASILVSHYAALPRVKNNQRDTDIANVFTTIKVHPKSSGPQLAQIAKNAILKELARRGCTFKWDISKATVRDPRNQADIALEPEDVGYFEKQLLVVPSGRNAKGKRPEYRDPGKQLCLRVVSPADEHERYVESLNGEREEDDDLALPSQALSKSGTQKRPGHLTIPSTASKRPVKRPRTKRENIELTFTELPPLVKRTPTPELPEDDKSLPNLANVLLDKTPITSSKAPVASKAPSSSKAMPHSKMTDANSPVDPWPQSVAVIDIQQPEHKSGKRDEPARAPDPRITIAGLVSTPTVIRSPPKTMSRKDSLESGSHSPLKPAEAPKPMLPGDSSTFQRALEAGGAESARSRKLVEFQNIVEPASIYSIPLKPLRELMQAATTNGPATLLDLFHSDRQLRGLETADLCVTVNHFRRGTFKTSHQAKPLAMHGHGPWPPTHISRFEIVAKRMYRIGPTGALERYPTEKELACLLDEGNLLLWCNALQKDCDLHVRRRIEEFGPPPSPIPELRFVTAAIATVVSRTQRPGGRHVFVPSMTGAYLLEERLTGRFVKYINNSECRPAAYLSPADGVYYENALYLCFCQHLQYWMTDGMAYISDYQGNDKILTDTQIITNPKRFKKNLFGDGNYTSAFETFPTKHECNKYCKWFGLNPFSKD